MRTVYVNGTFLPEDQAQISIFDRAVLFADAVYEVTAVLGGKLVDFEGHVIRLNRSLSELDIAERFSSRELLSIHRSLIARNNLQEGLVYLQITRGVADRDFDFSNLKSEPGIILFTQEKNLIENPLARRGQRIGLVEDMRWGRSDIKSVQLLYSSLVKSRAKLLGADDVWMHKNGMITEGSSNNAYIVSEENQIITRNLTNDILHGITRHSVLEIARLHQMTVVERPFSIEELKSAREAFSTSASGFVNPVVNVENSDIGNGRPGPVAQALREYYVNASVENAM